MTAWTRASLLRLALLADYQSPFERVTNWLYATNPAPGSLRYWLGRRAERADNRWREHYVKADRYPPRYWRRKL